MSKIWSIGVSTPITPQDPLPPMPNLQPGELLVIEGRAPIWRYAMALHRAHGSAAGAVAVFDPRLGYVVTVSHSPKFKEGEILPSESAEVRRIV
jgi:CRISPR-associated protein Csx3